MSNVRLVHLINVIEVRSYYGAGIKEDPGREVVEYFSMEGDLLAFSDQWAENEKQKESNSELLRKSYPLTEYVTYLLRHGDITATDGESSFEIALRCWKSDRERINNFLPSEEVK